MIREMKEADIDEVLRLEEKEFHSGSKENLFTCVLGDSYRYFVLIHGGRIVGYSGFLVAGDDAEIIQIMIESSFRGNGFGKLLLMDGLERLKKEGKLGCILEVRESNEVAQRLYKSVGFKVISLRKNYYGNESAIVMKLEF